jgi:5-methylthioadenosine/S-adenosylhomocysteine deaminase
MRVFQNISYLVVNADDVLQNVDMLVAEGRIRSVGARLPVPSGAEQIDCAGCAVLPGFVNAHTHLYQMLLVGRRDDLPLSGWCGEVLGPMVAALYGKIPKPERERFSYLWAACGIAEMLRSGVTAFLDMDVNYAQDGIFRAAAQAGVHGYAGVELADLFMSTPTGLKRDLAEIERLLGTYPEKCVLTPSEPNLTSESAMRSIAALAKNYGSRVQTHVDETAAEARQCVAEKGEPELCYLDRLGLLSPRFSAVHGVHMTPREIELAAERGITLVYNPKSNAKLGSGICPVPALMRAGVNIALATDGPASNDRLDLFEEMRFGAMLQKAACQDPTAVTAKDVFRMATAGGARLLSLDSGVLEEGLPADFSIVPLQKAHLGFGTGDIISTLVYCTRSGDVRDVYVGGRPVLHEGVVTGFDESAVHAEFFAVLTRIMEELHA